MKYEFDQKRADRDAVLYNTDGRAFDLVETGGNLEIVARPAGQVLWWFTLMPGITIGALMLTLIPPGVLPDWQRYALFSRLPGFSRRFFSGSSVAKVI